MSELTAGNIPIALTLVNMRDLDVATVVTISCGEKLLVMRPYLEYLPSLVKMMASEHSAKLQCSGIT